MKHELFCMLTPAGKLYYVQALGIFLAQRWAEGDTINLYHCADGGRGFFVEVSYDKHGQALVLRSFSDSAQLEGYAREVQLPKW